MGDKNLLIAVFNHVSISLGNQYLRLIKPHLQRGNTNHPINSVTNEHVQYTDTTKFCS